MMLSKAFFILSVLLSSLVIQPSSTAARDLAHDTQTKVDVQKSLDAAALRDTGPSIAYKPLNRSRPALKPVPSGRPYTPSPCNGYYRCRNPPSSP